MSDDYKYTGKETARTGIIKLTYVIIVSCNVPIDFTLYVYRTQSEEHDDELTCLGLFKYESKLLAASNKGKMYIYNWEEFGLHSDEFPSATKKAINCMIPVTENVVIIGGEDGIVR